MPVITPMPVETIFTNVGTVAGEIFDALGAVVGTITSQPLLLLLFCLGLVSAVVGIAVSIFHRLRG